MSTENPEMDETKELTAIDEIVGKYVDYTNTAAVRVFPAAKLAVVNITQIEAHRLPDLEKELNEIGVELIKVEKSVIDYTREQL